MLEDDDVAALRLAAEDPPLERAERPGQRMLRIAVSVLGDEQVVADQQRRLHRPGRDPERLEQQRAEHHRDEDRVDDRFDRFCEAVRKNGRSYR